MFDVGFRKSVLEGVHDFAKEYEQCFVNLFHDSGIWCEHIILEKYRLASYELHDRFIDEMIKRLSENTLLGRKKVGIYFEIKFHVNRYILHVRYTENKIEKRRIVEWISINRK